MQVWMVREQVSIWYYPEVPKESTFFTLAFLSWRWSWSCKTKSQYEQNTKPLLDKPKIIGEDVKTLPIGILTMFIQLISLANMTNWVGGFIIFLKLELVRVTQPETLTWIASCKAVYVTVLIYRSIDVLWFPSLNLLSFHLFLTVLII